MPTNNSTNTQLNGTVTLVGNGAGNLTYTGTQNTGIGENSLHALTSGQFNVAIGDGSLGALTSGTFNCAMGTDALAALTSGTQNMGIGQNALATITTGGANTGIGYATMSFLAGASSNNTAIGYLSLVSCTGGAGNTCVGWAAGFNYTGAESHNILLGENVLGTLGESNAIRIGVQGTQTTCFIAGIRGVTVTGQAVLCSTTGQLGTVASSIRFKENIESIDKFSSKLMECNPVCFTYKTDETKGMHFGMIAEEVVDILPELVLMDEEGLPESIAYHEMPAMLLNEIKKLKARIEHLEARLS